MTATDNEAYARGLLRPRRPDLAAALAAFAGSDDPREVWARLAPPARVDGPPRRFRGWCQRCLRSGLDDVVRCPACRGSGYGVFDVPSSHEQAIALCADPVGFVEAERLACEAVSRLRDWGCPQPAALVWTLGWERFWREIEFDRALGTARVVAEWAAMSAPDDAFATALANSDDLAARLSATGAACWGDAFRDAWGAACWPLAVASRGSVVRPPGGVPGYFWDDAGAALAGRPLADLPDPFAPLASLWATGYAIEEVTRDELVLVVPEVEA